MNISESLKTILIIDISAPPSRHYSRRVLCLFGPNLRENEVRSPLPTRVPIAQLWRFVKRKARTPFYRSFVVVYPGILPALNVVVDEPAKQLAARETLRLREAIELAALGRAEADEDLFDGFKLGH